MCSPLFEKCILGYVGAKIGMSMGLLAQKAFGEKGSYLSSAMISFTQINWFAVGGVILGAVVANVVKFGIASINGMVVAAVCYLIGHVITKNK